MQITTISRGSFEKGKELAEALAGNLGHVCISREELVEAAIKDGIPVGKMEAAIVKPRRFNDRFLLIKEHYQAFATSYLCERALQSNIVYHGRAGHLLFPGIRHILRVKVIENIEQHIHSVMTRMNISRDKANRYIEDVNEDLHRWIKTLYGVDWNEFSQYDLTLNFDNMTTVNAATALCSLAALPEFQGVPASTRILENLRLASQARLALARDKHTANASFRIECVGGIATVTYRPVNTQVAEMIPDIVGRVDGIKEVVSTMAATHILWIQEDFTNSQETYNQVVDIANRWNAAVELIRYNPDFTENQTSLAEDVANSQPVVASSSDYNGGIEDDTPDTASTEQNDGGLNDTYSMLAKDGVAGRHFSCGGETQHLLNTLDGNVKYNLVAIGNVFTTKGHAAQIRMRRELIASLSDKLHTPVVEAEELEKTYMFTFNQAIKFAAFFVLAAAIFLSVMTHQGAILTFVHATSLSGKILAAAFVVVLVPFYAFLYGNFAKTLLKLVRIE